MTVNTQTVREVLPANGLAVEFPFTFPVLDPSHIVVTLYDPDGLATLQVQNTDYTVTLAGVGGAVVFGEAPLDEWEVRIERVMPVTQPTDFRNQGRFYPESHERAFDRILMLVQQARQSATDAMNLVGGDPASVAGRWDALLRRISNLAPGTEPADAVNLQQFQDALDAIGHSVWATFHDTTGSVDTPPATPSGAAPWDDDAQTWEQYPSADTVWISFSLGRSPGANGWWAPIRIVGQDYRPNLYSDPSFAGPHAVTLPPATPPEDLVVDVNGFIDPGAINEIIANAGGDTDPIDFVTTAGTPNTYAWSWAQGGAGLTINNPTTAQVTLTAPAGEAAYAGILQCVAGDGVTSVTRQIPVNIAVAAPAANPPATLSATASPTDLDVTFDDVSAAYTGFVQINPVGGRAPLTYSWSKVSGSANLALSDIDPVTGSQMRFRAVNPDPTNGGVLSATFRCRVQDSAQLDGYTRQTFDVDVPVVVTFNASVDPDPEQPLAVSVNPASLSVNLPAPSQEVGGTIDTQALVSSVVNAVGAVTYAWSWQAGGAGITIVDDDAASTALRVGADFSNLTGTLRLTVTDQDLREATVDVAVSISTAAPAPALTATVNPTALSRTIASGLLEGLVGSATAFGAGGTLPYTYTWRAGEVLVGGDDVEIWFLLNGAQATFYASRGVATSSTFKSQRFYCDVRDAGFKIATVQVDVSVTFQGFTGGGPVEIPE